MRSLTPRRRLRGCAKMPFDPVPGNPLCGLLQEYCGAALAEGCAPDTARTQRQAILRFIVWAHGIGIQGTEAISPAVLEKYQQHLFLYRKPDARPLTIGAQLVALAALKAWFRWQVRKQHLVSNPASSLRLPRLPEILPATILSAARVEAIFMLADTRTALGLRDRAMLELFYSGGIRRMELINMNIADADTAEGLAMVRRGKGRKDRLVPIGARACRCIERYLKEARPKLASAASGGALFLDDYGRPLSARYLGDLVRRYLENAGIKTRGSCHVFRHAMATHMLDNGADIRHIQAILGHARLETTQIYTRVSIRKLKEVHAATHPTAKLQPENEK